MKICKRNGFSVAAVLVLVLSLVCGLLLVDAADGAKSVRYELEDLNIDPIGNPWIWGIENDPAFSDGNLDALGVGAVVFYNVYDSSNGIKFTFNVEDDGTYLVTMGYVMDTNSGLFDVTIDDTKMPLPIDMSRSTSWIPTSNMVGSIDLTAGEHTLTIRLRDGYEKTEGRLDYMQLDAYEGTVSYKFAGQSYIKSDGNIHLESPYINGNLPAPADSVVFANLNAAGNSIETTSLIIPEDGKYNVSLDYLLDRAHGIVQIAIDDTNVGDPVNTNHDGGWTLASAELGEIELTAGIHKITITAVESDKYEMRLYALNLELIPEEPSTEPPATEAPTESPATQAPTEPPATEAPTESPATEAPTEPPATEAPTESPATQVPTEPPVGNNPSTGSIGIACVVCMAIVIGSVLLIYRRKVNG